ncbi:reverse transcriptase domain-containing protein, partial [Tanacetum coccineum]
MSVALLGLKGRGSPSSIGHGSPRSIGSSGSPRSRWVTKDQRDILLSIKPGDIDTDNVPVVAVVRDKVDVGKKPAEVKNKAPDVVKHKAPVVGKKKPAGNVVKDTTLVKDKVHSDVVEDKVPDVVKFKAPVVGKKKLVGNVVKDTTPVKDKVHSDVVNDKAQVDVHSDFNSDKVHDDIVKDKAPDAVKEKRKTELPKDKASSDVTDKPSVDVVKDNALEVVKEKRKTDLLKDKPKGKATSVVKSKVLTKLPKDKAKDKPYIVKGKVLTELSKDKHKAGLPKDKPKSKDKHNVDSEVPVLRSKSKCKPEVKAKGFVKRKRILSKEDHSKKKFEVKMVKGKMDIDDSNSELDSDEVILILCLMKELRRMLKKLKKIKKEDSDEESGLKSKKKGKKKEKKLTAHKEYLLSFPTILARTVSSSLFSAIREARVDMWSFLSEISFSSFHNVAIDKILSRLGRYMVANFSSFTYRLTLDTDAIPIEHEFVRLLADQFYPKSLKDIRVGTNLLDAVKRLHEDCVISKIDWCGYIHSCLEDNKLPKKRTAQYLGPFTFLILLYLDSTKFDRFPVVHTRPAIKDWTSTLMRQRQDLETKEHVIGCLDLHDEWTESELQETEGFTRVSSLETSERKVISSKEKLTTICSERVFLEDLMRKASSDYPGDKKFVELQEKYVQLFRDPISFDVDVSSVDGGNDTDGDDDGDDVNDDGNGNTNEELNDKEPFGSNPSFGFSKVSFDYFDKQPSGSGKSPKNQVVEKESIDPTIQETVVEEIPTEEYEIMSKPESYTQWLERNAYLVGEMIDFITNEYLYGDLFGQNLGRMEVLNQGPLTPERMPTRASNVSPGPEKLVMKPSSYLVTRCTDISKITRKPSKTGKHGREERKSTKEARDAKPKAGKVKKSKLWSTLGQFSCMRTRSQARNRNRRQQQLTTVIVEEPEFPMADNRTMAQMLQAPIEGYEDAIVVPPINANNFELKQTLINLVQSNQFTGKQDPHNHLRFFNKVTSTFRHPEVPNTTIKLLLFPFSLEGEARTWLDKEPPRSILTWDDLVSKFINQFFPPSKTTYLRNEITTFYQKPNETFNKAWERFKGLLRQCP